MSLAGATQAAASWWARMSWGNPDHYWDSLHQRHRDVLMAMLEEVEPFGRVLEIGCNAGPNLRRIHERWPDVALVGIDVNEEALAHGQARVAEEGWSDKVRFLHGELRESLATMRENPDARFDVVISCYTLTYFGPGDWHLLIRDLLGVTLKACIFLEPMITETEREPLGRGPHEYRHDYVGFFEAFSDLTVQRFPVDPPVQSLNQGLLVTSAV